MELKLGAGRPPVAGLNDNTSTIHLAEDKGTPARSSVRHIRVRVHKTRDHVGNDNVSLTYCPTSLMLADIMTKPMAPKDFVRFRKCLMGATDAAVPLTSIWHNISKSVNKAQARHDAAHARSASESISVRGGDGMAPSSYTATDYACFGHPSSIDRPSLFSLVIQHQ
jgi:hypothetical protein